MPRESLIEVEQVTRYYGAHLAASNISFTVHRGDILGFLGPNGAGKTTTMEMISGVLAPSSGNVRIAGHDMAAAAQQAKQHIGFLPEQPPLYPDLCVDEYLLYCARLRRLKKSALAAAVAECKARCGLEEVGSRLIGNLSRGYQQRTGIAQAIIHNPSVILLDEPTSGLDPIQIREIRALIQELGQGHSVILSTHILPEVQGICNRVLIIHEGRLVLDQGLDLLHKGADQTLRIRIGLHTPPDMAVLLALDGIESVELMDDHRFMLACNAQADATAMIVHAAVSRGWGLYELVPESDSLEATFMRLTRGDFPVQGSTREDISS